MPYVPNKACPQEIRVEATVFGQQVVNIFHLKASQPLTVSDGSSQTLLTDFRTAYRANILAMAYAPYIISQYVMSEITDTMLIPAKPECKLSRRFKTIYDPDKKELIEGVDPQDKGQTAGVSFLPCHEALRTKKKPMVRKRGFFEANYNRFCPFIENNHSDTNPEQWDPALLTTWDAGLQAMLIASYTDGSVNGNWAPAVWSAGYFHTVVKPVGGATEKGTQFIQTWTASKFVGTQVSRRYTTRGLPQGS